MQRKIMIVDDDRLILHSLSMLLEMNCECEIIKYNNPSEALKDESLNENKVDLVISDFIMPELNGLQFLSEVKKTTDYPELIILTGYADKENAIKAINELGLYYYLEKPWDNSSIISVVKNALEKKILEEANILKYKMMGTDGKGLYLLDNELSQRVYTPVTTTDTQA